MDTSIDIILVIQLILYMQGEPVNVPSSQIGLKEILV